MQPPALADVVHAYSRESYSAVATAEQELINKHWLKDLIPLLIEAYPKIRLSHGRASILFRLLKWTREHSGVVPLAQSALADRSYLVREHACGILAYSLRADMVPALQLAAAHPDPRTQAEAAAAIDAINHQNHHYFIDRKHTGQSFWLVNPSDSQDRDVGV